jgi:hypothetical protein
MLWHRLVVRVGSAFLGRCYYGRYGPHRNKLPLLFLHLGTVPSGVVGSRVAWSSRRSLDSARFMSGNRWSALLRATVVFATVVVFAFLQLGTWMMAGDDVPIL